MPEPKTYTGGCHCGAVRYSAVADLAQVIACNCSICHKKGLVLAFVPAAQFELLSGEERLTDYRFASKTIAHLFCVACGVQSFARGAMPDGTEMAALNLRCLDDFDLDTVDIQPFDGKNYEPATQ